MNWWTVLFPWLLMPTVSPTPTMVPTPPTPTPIVTEARVAWVVDGDTLAVWVDKKPVTIRLLGVDAPELSNKDPIKLCWAKKAKAALKDLAAGKDVVVESDPTQRDKDKYGRELRYVGVGKTDVDLWLVEKGYAQVYDYFEVTRITEYRNAQQQAKAKKLGMWSGKCRE